MTRHKQKSKSQPSYVETSLGIVTTGGNWFHTSSDQIEEMVPQIFEHCTLGELVNAAEIWIKSADSLSLLLYFVLILVVPPVISALLVLSFFLFWYVQKSALVSPYLTTILQWINKDGTLIIISGISLSWLGMTNQFVALAIGILYFFIFKLGLLRWGMDYLYEKVRSGLPLNDRLFKMLILKYAIRHGIEVPEIEEMDQKVKAFITRQHGSK